MTVSNTSATPGTPTGTVAVAADGGSCTATLTATGVGTASGSCSIGFVPDGTWTVTATYSGDANFAPGTPVTTSVTVTSPGPGPGPGHGAPVFGPAFPSLNARPGQLYSYTFHAVGAPVIRYSLSGPFWLHINPFTGTVSGTVPNFGGSFSYSVTATNGVGQATDGPYFVRVFVRPRPRPAQLSTSLSCTPRVFSGERGSCTLSVTDHGGSTSPNVTAQINLPSQLRADYCGYFFNFGCNISNNTAYENLGTLSPGQTKSLTVVFTAKRAFNLWGFHPRHAFTVKVNGSASSSGGFPFFGHSTSYSFAFVTIFPRF